MVRPAPLSATSLPATALDLSWRPATFWPGLEQHCEAYLDSLAQGEDEDEA